MVEEMTKSPIQRIRRFLGSLLCITALKRVYVSMTNKKKVEEKERKRKRKERERRKRKEEELCKMEIVEMLFV